MPPENAPTPRPGSITDIMRQVPGLELAHRDWRAMCGMRRPAQVSIWLALLRTQEELESRAEGLERLPDGEIASIPAALRLGEVIVGKMLKGDMTAAQMVLERIEGRVGTRRGETDDEGLSREQMGDVIESIIGAYTSQSRSRPERAIDIEVISDVAARVMRDQRVEADTTERDAETRRLNAEETHNDDSTAVAAGYTNGQGGGLHD
jgi:hypothetical protein